MHYLPLSPGSFSVLLVILFAVFVLIEVGVLRYAYVRLGVSSTAAAVLLIASLGGSYFNIPVAQLSGEHVLAGHELDFYGMRYIVPVVVDWPGTIVAVNVGGCLVPVLVSAYLLLRYPLWGKALVATAIVAFVTHWLAQPMPGLGIAEPVFGPVLTTAIAALLLSRADAPKLAYIGGSMGTLIGADLLNLSNIPGLGAPVASIGGAGTFDGIFLTGILAVLFSALFTPRPRLGPSSGDL